jgi:hypothetical protein
LSSLRGFRERAKQLPRRLPQRGKGQNNFRGACHSVANANRITDNRKLNVNDMKIATINLHNLQNAEHFQFHTDALALMTAAPPAALKIAARSPCRISSRRR